MWTPLDARTWNWPRPPTICWISSVHTPAALMTWRARIVNSLPVSRSLTGTPTTRSSWRTNPTRHDLVESHRLYATLGYEEVPALNGGPYAEHRLAKPLV